MKTPSFGSWVTVRSIYRRRVRHVTRPGRTIPRREKIWERDDGKNFKALCIGTRTLCDGWTEWIDEVGYVFNPTLHFPAVVVVRDAKSKPILCPISAVKEVAP